MREGKGETQGEEGVGGERFGRERSQREKAMCNYAPEFCTASCSNIGIS